MRLTSTDSPATAITAPAACAPLEGITLESCQAKADAFMESYANKIGIPTFARYAKAIVSDVRGKVSLIICPNFTETPPEAVAQKRDATIGRMLGELKGAYPEGIYLGQSVQFASLGAVNDLLDSLQQNFAQYAGR